MRIAMFTNNYKPFIGGVPVSIEQLSDGLRALGHTVYIFAPDYGVEETDEYVIRYRTLYQKEDKSLMVGDCFDREVERRFRELSFDVIHVHHPMLSGYTALYLGKKYGVPVAYTYHTRYEEYLHYFKFFQEMQKHDRVFRGVTRYSREVLVPKYMTAFAKQCDLIFAPTNLMRDLMLKQGVDTRITILPTGLRDSAFVRDEERAAAIRARYLGDRKYLFCTIARLEKEKNLDFLLDGIREMKAQMGDSFCVMVIGDGSEREHLTARVEAEGLSGQVAFLGRIPNAEIRDYQFASDAFLFASKSETQGIVLLEAMASGSPVIAVKASGVVDVVRNGFNGYMTGESVSEWVAAVRRTVEYPEQYRWMSAQAEATAANYHNSSIAREAEMQYTEMVNTWREKKIWRMPAGWRGDSHGERPYSAC